MQALDLSFPLYGGYWEIHCTVHCFGWFDGFATFGEILVPNLI